MNTMNRQVSRSKRQKESSGFKNRMLGPILGVIALVGQDSLLAVPDTLAAAPAKSAAAATVQIGDTYGKLPLHFEANQGQTDSQVKFLSRSQGYNLLLTSTEAVLALRQQSAVDSQQPAVKPPDSRLGTLDSRRILRLRLVGANPQPHVAGLEELPGKVNYFLSNDQTKWRTHIPLYAKVKYEAVYPGVDLVYHGNQRQLEYDFIVAPGVDPKIITLDFAGVDKLEVDVQGNLVLHTVSGQIRQPKPFVYQEVDGVRKEVSAGYMLRGLPTSNLQPPTSLVGFQIAQYDTTKLLIIDPILWYSTFLGGSSSDLGTDIAVDNNGATYVVGTTHSLDFPTQNPLPTAGFPSDVFVTKLSATNSPDETPTLVYSTYLGGSGLDEGKGIVVDSNNNVYITGLTSSFNFPTTTNAFQQHHAGGTSAEFPTDAFVTKLNAAGSTLRYSTYLGGSGEDSGKGIALDSNRNAYVTGQTTSPDDFPTKSPFLLPTQKPFQTESAGSTDAFITALNPAAAGNASLVFSTYLGGSGFDSGNAVAVNSLGDAYVTGQTDSTDFPTTTAAPGDKPGTDAFMVRYGFDRLRFSRYLGGSGTDIGKGIVVDSLDNAYITGLTGSPDFPLQNSQDTLNVGGNDAFVVKLFPGKSDGSTGPFYSILVGSTGAEAGLDIALDSSDNAWITGQTTLQNIPGIPIPPGTLGGTASDAFVVQIVSYLDALPGGGVPTQPQLVFGVGSGAYLFGSNDDWGSGIAVDASDRVYVVGTTRSANFSISNAPQPTFSGGVEDAFVVKLEGDF